MEGTWKKIIFYGILNATIFCYLFLNTKEVQKLIKTEPWAKDVIWLPKENADFQLSDSDFIDLKKQINESVTLYYGDETLHPLKNKYNAEKEGYIYSIKGSSAIDNNALPLLAGSWLHKDEENTAVITEDLAISLFKKQENIVGEELILDQQSYQIVGILRKQSKRFISKIAPPFHAVYINATNQDSLPLSSIEYVRDQPFIQLPKLLSNTSYMGAVFMDYNTYILSFQQIYLLFRFILGMLFCILLGLYALKRIKQSWRLWCIERHNYYFLEFLYKNVNKLSICVIIVFLLTLCIMWIINRISFQFIPPEYFPNWLLEIRGWITFFKQQINIIFNSSYPTYMQAHSLIYKLHQLEIIVFIVGLFTSIRMYFIVRKATM